MQLILTAIWDSHFLNFKGVCEINVKINQGLRLHVEPSIWIYNSFSMEPEINPLTGGIPFSKDTTKVTEEQTVKETKYNFVSDINK